KATNASTLTSCRSIQKAATATPWTGASSGERSGEPIRNPPAGIRAMSRGGAVAARTVSAARRGPVTSPGFPGHQLRRRCPGPGPSQVPRELEESGRVELLQVSAVDRVLEALAPRLYRPNGDHAPADLDDPSRLLQERAPPASRLQAPRPHEHASFHHH